MNLSALAKAYTDHVLDEQVHARLIENIDRYAAEANIPAGMIYHSLKEHCTPDEIEYVRRYQFMPDENIFGLLYTKMPNAAVVHTRMMAMAAAYLRNFINAKVLTVQDILVQIKANKFVQPTILLIPNFFISENQGGKIAPWEISELLGVLYNRHAADHQTIVFVDSLPALRKEYGAAFADHLTQYFLKITK